MRPARPRRKASSCWGGSGVEPLTDDFDIDAFHAGLQAPQCADQAGAAGRRPGGGRRQHLCVGGAVPGGHPADAACFAHQPPAGRQAARGRARGAGPGGGQGRQHAARFFQCAGAGRLLPAGGHGVRPGGPAVPGLRRCCRKPSARASALPISAPAARNPEGHKAPANAIFKATSGTQWALPSTNNSTSTARGGASSRCA